MRTQDCEEWVAVGSNLKPDVRVLIHLEFKSLIKLNLVDFILTSPGILLKEPYTCINKRSAFLVEFRSYKTKF